MIKYFHLYKEKLFFIIIHFSLLTAVVSMLFGESAGLQSRNINLFFSPLPLVFDQPHFFSKVTLRIAYKNKTNDDIELDKNLLDQIQGPNIRKLHFARLLMFSKFFKESWIVANVKYHFCNQSKLTFLKSTVDSVKVVINNRNHFQVTQVSCE